MSLVCCRYCSRSSKLFARADGRFFVPRRRLASSSQQLKEQPAIANAVTQLQGRDDASLARYPNLRSPGGILRGLDYAGTLTFGRCITFLGECFSSLLLFSPNLLSPSTSRSVDRCGYRCSIWFGRLWGNNGSRDNCRRRWHHP